LAHGEEEKGGESWATGKKGEGEMGLLPQRGVLSFYFFSILLSFIPKPFSNPF